MSNTIVGTWVLHRYVHTYVPTCIQVLMTCCSCYELFVINGNAENFLKYQLRGGFAILKLNEIKKGEFNTCC